MRPSARTSPTSNVTPGPLRIAVTTTAFNGVDVDPLCTAAAHQAAEWCAELGHRVVEAAPAIDPEEFETR
jgi:amidase